MSNSKLSKVPSFADTGSDSSDSESGTAKSPLQRRKITRNWTLDRTFENQAEVGDFLTSESTWRKDYFRDTEQGQKVFYYCNKTPKRSPTSCQSAIYLLYHFDSSKVR